MTMVEIQQPNNRIRYPEIDITRASLEYNGSMRAERTPSPAVKEDIMFVALGKDEKESETVLMWALNNSRGMKICILHVHQPAQKMPMLGTRVPISLVEENQVKAHHENERQEMHKILNKYVQTCEQAKVRAEKLCIEMGSIDKGIVQVISEHGVRWLVMGAAANRPYLRKMKEPKSKKAIHVRLKAPSFCEISFIYKGNLIHTRERKLGGVDVEAVSPPFPAGPNTETTESLRSRSVAEGQKGQFKSQDYRRVKSTNYGMQRSAPSNGSGEISPQSNLNTERNFDWHSPYRRSPSVSSSNEIFEDSALTPHPRTEGNEIGSKLPMFQQNASSAIEGDMTNDELCDRLEQFVAEAESSRKEAYEESIRRKKAEREVIHAIRRAKASETMHAEELRRRSEIEEALKWQLHEVMEELRVAKEHKFSLQCQIADSDKVVKELERKMLSAVELSQQYKKQRDELQLERDNALRIAEELRKKQAEEASSSSASPFFSDKFPFFSQALKIGEGGY